MGAALERAVATDDADIAADCRAEVVNPVIRPLHLAKRFWIRAMRGRAGVCLIRPRLAFGKTVCKQAGKGLECVVDDDGDLEVFFLDGNLRLGVGKRTWRRQYLPCDDESRPCQASAAMACGRSIIYRLAMDLPWPT